MLKHFGSSSVVLNVLDIKMWSDLIHEGADIGQPYIKALFEPLCIAGLF